MPVYFVFSDEAGDYQPSPSLRFVRANPYFIRAGIIMDGEDWASLRSAFAGLCISCQLPADCELKWSYICSLIAHRKRNELVSSDRPYAAFDNFSNESLLDFVRSTLGLLKRNESCRIVFTITDNNLTYDVDKDKLYRMHIQDLMQRTEMQLQAANGLAVMFLDPKDEAADNLVRNAYAAIYRDGDFIRSYSHMTDSLSFVLSQQSFGIRFADYAAGVFNNFMRGYSESTELFKTQIWPLVRKSPSLNPLGWGICEIPTDARVRNKIKEALMSNNLLAEDYTRESLL